MKDRHFDSLLFIVVFVLAGIGVVMVYESSSAIAEYYRGDSAYFLKNHVLRAFIGLLFIFVLARINYRHLLKIYPLFLGAAFLLLILLLIFPSRYVIEVNGARRWLEFHGVSFQPAELMKFAMVLYLAEVFIKKRERRRDSVPSPWPQFVILSIALGLIALQPHLGTIIIILGTCTLMLIIAGTRFKHLLLYYAGIAPFAGLTLLFHPYQWQRILDYIQSLRTGQPQGYQIRQSLISLGSGGLWGVGLGNSKQKLFFLPEPHKDFILAIVGEVWGFIGILFVFSLFLVLLWRGLRIAAHAPDDRGTLLAFGITAMITLNVLLNVGVVSNLLPITGLPLPFISYGGTSLLTNMAGVGILLNISKQPRTPLPYFHRVL